MTANRIEEALDQHGKMLQAIMQHLGIDPESSS